MYYKKIPWKNRVENHNPWALELYPEQDAFT
jgi:hypothetical protein